MAVERPGQRRIGDTGEGYVVETKRSTGGAVDRMTRGEVLEMDRSGTTPAEAAGLPAVAELAVESL